MSYEQAQKRLIELMTDSVRERLMADVPLGTFLSGGIDSSIITALAAKEVKNLNDLATFCLMIRCRQRVKIAKKNIVQIKICIL